MYQEPLSFDKGVGVILGSFSPLHKGHLDMIFRAKKECLGGVIVVVCGYKGDKGYPLMTLKERYQMVRQFFQDDPLIAVYCLSDDELGISQYQDNQNMWQWDKWLVHLISDVLQENQKSKDSLSLNITFYVGEKEYQVALKERGFKTVLVNRKINPITATMIRKSPLKYWEQMAWTFHRRFSHNILITGTASEGKTTLVEDIGRYFNIPYSYEWARSYIKKHCIGDWEFDSRDFVAFLNGQYNYNRDCIESKHNKGVFISDTDCIVTKMYAKYYANDDEMALTMDEYRRVIEPVADMYIAKSRWDKIFILTPCGEFVDDHTRYLKHSSLAARKNLAYILIDELHKAGLSDKVEILEGGYLENFNKVKTYIESLEVSNRGKI